MLGEKSERAQSLISHTAKQHCLERSSSDARDELKAFRAWLKWLCVDQSNAWTACLSWVVFLGMAIVVPTLSHFVLACTNCDSRHSRPYDAVAQMSLSGVAALSFICLSTFIWWYGSGGTRISFLGNVMLSNTVACILELCSWFYRTVVFFLVCILFRLICCLQILRLQDFAEVFKLDSNVESVLKEHLRIRRHLRIISHRYRSFILWALIVITASQFACLLMTTRPNADVNLYHTGELAVCCVSLLAGLLILLRSATRITHKAQAVTCLAAKWHVCATIDSFDTTEAETPVARRGDEQSYNGSMDGSSDIDEVGDEEDELDNCKFVPSYAHSTISFQKRQALVTYFENNRAGITVYGFMLDRTTLHTIFGIELSLVLWLLGKTIGVS